MLGAAARVQRPQQACAPATASPALDTAGLVRAQLQIKLGADGTCHQLVRLINMGRPLRRSPRTAISGRRRGGGHYRDRVPRASGADADPADDQLQEQGGAGQAPYSTGCTV